MSTERTLLVHLHVNLGSHAWQELDAELDPHDHASLAAELAEHALQTGQPGEEYTVVAAEEI